MKTLLFILTILFLTSCASVNFPPDPAQIDRIKSNLGKLDQEVNKKSEENIWATLFLNAKHFEEKGDINQACILYSKLAAMKKFPLHSLSQIKKMSTCSLPAEELELFWQSSIPYWLKEFYAKQSLRVATANKDKKYIAHFSALASKFERLQENKITFLKKAIAIAPQEEKEKYIEQLYRVAPHTYPKPTNENIHNIAKDFEKNRKFVTARKLYWKIVKSDDFTFKERVDAYDRIRLSFKLQRNTKKYLKYTQKMDRFIRRYLHREFDNPEYQKRWIESQITLARLYWTEDNARKSRIILFSLLKRKIDFPDIEAQIYHVLAGISLEERKTGEAIELLAEAQKSNIEDLELKDKINWFYGWNLFLNKQYPEAAASFEQAIKESENYFFKIKCSFWEAKSYQANGDKEGAEELLNEIADQDSFGYYGIMAHRELKRPFSSLTHQYQNAGLITPKLPVFEWLIVLDQLELAKSYLRFKGPKTFKENSEIESSLALYNKANDFSWQIHQFYRIDAPFREDALSRKAYLVFPTPYQDQFKKVANRFQHSQEYLYSIARQESAFDPEARSPAEAYGLMQLIPKRGRELSRKYNIKYSGPQDLYRPNINIFMGGALLRILKGDLKSRFVLTTASYNAKISAVKRWFKKRFDGDYLTFIEMIPYSETQGYIKLVLRNFITYKRLQSSSKFLFPETIFTGDY